MQAVLRLNDDFYLNLSLNSQSDEQSREQSRQRRAEQRRRQQEKAFKCDEYNFKANLFKQYSDDLEQFRPRSEFDFVHPRFIEALHKIEYLRYWLDENISQGVR